MSSIVHEGPLTFLPNWLHQANTIVVRLRARKLTLWRTNGKRWARLMFEDVIYPCEVRSHACWPVRAILGLLPCGRYLLSDELVVLRETPMRLQFSF